MGNAVCVERDRDSCCFAPHPTPRPQPEHWSHGASPRSSSCETEKAIGASPLAWGKYGDANPLQVRLERLQRLEQRLEELKAQVEHVGRAARRLDTWGGTGDTGSGGGGALPDGTRSTLEWVEWLLGAVDVPASGDR